MKRLIFLFFCSFLFINSQAQITIGGNKLATVSFKETTWDFGTIKEGAWPVHEFEFTNNDSKPIFIIDAITSCDCTHIDFSKEPIMPGKTAKIKVGFDSKGKDGNYNRTITVKFSTGKQDIFIKVNVKK